jgi:DNA-binding transcriptional LysR family regulator
MNNWESLIGSPRHLFVFEAAARCGSFTAAAREIGVSQPAVSQSMRQLEAALGTELFARGHRRFELTTSGERLFSVVSNGLGQILRTAQAIRNEHKDRPVTLSTSSAFANYWMVPRLAGLHAIAPGIDLRMQVSDRDVELEVEGISLGVRRGMGDWPGYSSQVIAAERLLPVASPAYLNRKGRPQCIEDLHKHVLIHLEEPIRPRPVWADWFTGMGGAMPVHSDGLRLNDYALVLQAAMAGEGIAMGWQHVTTKLLEQNLLEQALDMTWESGSQFHLLWPDTIELSEHAVLVRDWIIKESSAMFSKARPRQRQPCN